MNRDIFSLSSSIQNSKWFFHIFWYTRKKKIQQIIRRAWKCSPFSFLFINVQFWSTVGLLSIINDVKNKENFLSSHIVMRDELVEHFQIAHETGTKYLKKKMFTLSLDIFSYHFWALTNSSQNSFCFSHLQNEK